MLGILDCACSGIFFGIIYRITELLRGVEAVGKNFVHGFEPRIGIDERHVAVAIRRQQIVKHSHTEDINHNVSILSETIARIGHTSYCRNKAGKS